MSATFRSKASLEQWWNQLSDQQPGDAGRPQPAECSPCLKRKSDARIRDNSCCQLPALAKCAAKRIVTWLRQLFLSIVRVRRTKSALDRAIQCGRPSKPPAAAAPPMAVGQSKAGQLVPKSCGEGSEPAARKIRNGKGTL